MSASIPLTSSIRVVSGRTGIGAHALRVWERRYGFPKPERRSDGVRAYTEADIDRLKLVARALDAGFRAGEVVPLPVVDLRRLLDAAQLDMRTRPAPSTPRDRAVDGDAEALERVLHALAADDIGTIQATLLAEATGLGPRRFVTEVAHPLVVRVGELWSRGELEIRHEHLLSACLTRRLHALLPDDHEPKRAPVVLLATLPGEQHALPLDMVAVVLAAADAAPRMLGADTPVHEIASGARAMRADVVGLSISPVADRASTELAARELLRELPRRTELWLGGQGSAAIVSALGDGVALVDTWAALDARLRLTRASRA